MMTMGLEPGFESIRSYVLDCLLNAFLGSCRLVVALVPKSYQVNMRQLVMKHLMPRQPLNLQNSLMRLKAQAVFTLQQPLGTR